MQAIVR